MNDSLLRTIQTTVKTLETTKTAVKDNKNVRDHNGWSDCILFLCFHGDFSISHGGRMPSEEAGESPLSTNHAAARGLRAHLPRLIIRTQPPDLKPYVYLD